jgi:hypothetical protein
MFTHSARKRHICRQRNQGSQVYINRYPPSAQVLNYTAALDWFPLEQRVYTVPYTLLQCPDHASTPNLIDL